MIGISTFWIDCRNSCPMPGQANTVSVMIEKATIEPSCRPTTVMTGTSVLLSAWWKWTARSESPRALREADVVRAQHLEHLGAHQPHDQRHLEQRQRDRRHDQRLQPGDREQAGRPPRADMHDLAAPERRQPAQDDGEQIDQQHADQEGRQGDADQRQRLEQSARARCRASARCRRPSGRPATSESSEATKASSSVAGMRSPISVGDRLLELIGDAEIEPRGVGEKARRLDEHGSVEAELMAQLLALERPRSRSPPSG